MTNNTSTFTPSTQILEAGEKAQAFADAGKPLARFFSPEIQETVDGVEKIANALNSTGEALRHFGFDEDEDEVIGGSTLQERAEGAKQIAELYPPKELAGPLDAAGKIQAGVDYFTYDPSNPTPTISEIKQAVRNNDTKAINRYKMNQFTTGSQIIHEAAVRKVNDPNASAGDKIKATVADAMVQLNPITNTAKSIETLFSGLGKLTGWWDEMEPEAAEGPAFNSEFSSNPETLAPIDLNSSVVTDAYQQQEGPGAELIGGQMNKGTEPYQAQDSQYAVLA